MIDIVRRMHGKGWRNSHNWLTTMRKTRKKCVLNAFRASGREVESKGHRFTVAAFTSSNFHFSSVNFFFLPPRGESQYQIALAECQCIQGYFFFFRKRARKYDQVVRVSKWSPVVCINSQRKGKSENSRKKGKSSRSKTDSPHFIKSIFLTYFYLIFVGLRTRGHGINMRFGSQGVEWAKVWIFNKVNSRSTEAAGEGKELFNFRLPFSLGWVKLNPFPILTNG